MREGASAPHNENIGQPLAEILPVEVREDIQNFIETLEREHPKTIQADTQEQARLLDNSRRRNALIEDVDLVKALHLLGKTMETLTIEVDEEGFYHIPVATHFMEDRLPEGYGYKGGAARALLHRTLKLDPNAQPRDVDIVRFATVRPEPDADDEMGQKYMHQDYTYRKSGLIEEVVALDEYFSTRDFTLNEVIATDSEIIATKQCILDTARHIIRISDYEWDLFKGVGHKMLAKAIRLYAEEVHKFGKSEILEIGEEGEDEKLVYEEAFIPPFWMAVFLDRAFERSLEVADKYVKELQKRGQLPDHLESPEEAAAHLVSLMKDDGFVFRHAPLEQFREENKLLDLIDQYEDWEELPQFEGFGRRN